MESKPNIIIPFPGPERPFKTSERKFFFGRSNEVQELKYRLRREHIVALTSLPKAGKSSLILCGLLPDLEDGFFAKAGEKWNHIYLEPKGYPIRELGEALARFCIKKKTHHLEGLRVPPSFQEDITETLRGHPRGRGLIQVYKESPSLQSENLLLIIDHFDHLVNNYYDIKTKSFEYQSREDQQRIKDIALFFELLLEVRKHPDLAVYVIFSFSDDVLKKCNALPGLEGILKKYVFYLPILNQVQLQQAIIKPIEVGGGQIDPDLLMSLLKRLAYKPDQLVILQTYLASAWRAYLPDRKRKSLSIDHFKQATSISLKNRDEIVLGNEEPEPEILEEEKLVTPLAKEETVQEAENVQKSIIESKKDISIGEQAEMIYKGIPVFKQELCKKLIRAITQRSGMTTPPKNRPKDIKELENLMETSKDDILSLIEIFNALNDKIFMISNGKVSIGNQQIMDDWPAVQQWSKDEYSDFLIYNDLAETAYKYYFESSESEKRNLLWTGVKLERALLWLKESCFNRTWANMYNKNFNLAIDFLKLSREQQNNRVDPPSPPASPPTKPIQVVKTPNKIERPARPKIKIKPKK